MHFLESLMTLAAATATITPDLMILGLICLVIFGALVTPWIGLIVRTAPRLLSYVARRIWAMAIDRLITWVVLAMLALFGGIAWLAEVIELAAAILK